MAAPPASNDSLLPASTIQPEAGPAAVREPSAGQGQVTSRKSSQMRPPPSSRRTKSGVVLAHGGFDVQLSRISLHNLLQVEHMSGATGVFAVLSGEQVGYLHFASGELVHAQLGALDGDSAALEILSWGAGALQNSDEPVAVCRTVNTPLPTLILQLAVLSDEADTFRLADCTTAQLAPPRPSQPLSVASTSTQSEEPGGSTRTTTQTRRSAQAVVTRVELTAQGGVARAEGPAAEALASRISYAARMALLVGECLGSGTPRALVCRGAATKTLIEWTPNGGLSGQLKPVSKP